MPKTEQLPEYAIRLTTFQELERIAKAFASGHLNLVIVLGGPGLAKSWTLRQAVGSGACWIEGNASSFGIYCHLWDHRDQPLVIDDVNPNGFRLLKSLCQTEAVKTVGWHSDAPTLQKRGIPRQFTTNSQVAIIANRWPTANPDVAAFQDRGHVTVFDPSVWEVHRRVATWFSDQEVFDYLGEHLHLLVQPSRHYLAALELKRAGLDWKGLVLSRFLTGKSLIVAQLKASPAYSSEEERVQAFIAGTGASRATYFNLARKLQPAESCAWPGRRHPLLPENQG